MAARVKMTPDAVKQRAMAVMEARMHAGMQAAVRQTKVLLNTGGGKGHRASEEGQPPHKQSSLLFQSVTYRVTRTASVVRGLFGAGKVYALRLEFGFVGTDSRGRTYHQGPRPFVRRAWYDVKSEVLKLLRKPQ